VSCCACACLKAAGEALFKRDPPRLWRQTPGCGVRSYLAAHYTRKVGRLRRVPEAGRARHDCRPGSGEREDGGAVSERETYP
jgi:hypothetical protein